MGGDNFIKGDFIKTPMPFCSNCGMISVSVEPEDNEMIDFVKSAASYTDEIVFKCRNCKHFVNQSGDCILQERRRCSSCSGRPKCENCSKISIFRISSNVSSMFYCTSCDHPISDDGNCVKEGSCRSCHPLICNTCERAVEGELDDEGEIECTYCEHYIDGDGHCVSQNRGHCDTCDGALPQCPACGDNNDVYEDGYEDDDGDYIIEYRCHECVHVFDSDGDCQTNPCSDCGEPCTNCGKKYECDNGPKCSFLRDDKCQFCHCNDDYLPDCPDCGDNQDVEGPDDDGEFYCDYHECDSSNYFT